MIQFIALCGYPKAGKTEVQKVISRLYGFNAHDDSRPLRDATRTLYGLSEWHVSTQEGKASLIDIGGRKVPVRKAMGDLGCYLEAADEFHLPRLALKTCRTVAPDGCFVFASVRQNQPCFLKEEGGALVIEVTRPGCAPSDKFDEYSRDAIDITIQNHRDTQNPEASLAALEARVRAALDPLLARQMLPA